MHPKHADTLSDLRIWGMPWKLVILGGFDVRYKIDIKKTCIKAYRFTLNIFLEGNGADYFHCKMSECTCIYHLEM